ncbi:proliferation-associated protein 2G4 [Sigmodon hispidus]
MSGEEEHQEQTMAEDLVMTKYKMGGDIANRVLRLWWMLPAQSDQDYILKEGDLVKIDLGVYVDGFIANVAHTFVIGVAQGTQKLPYNWSSLETRTHKLQKPRTKLLTHSFNCTPIEGMLSHQLKQHVIDGEKTIIQNPTDQQKKDHEKAEVYAVDVLVSSGEVLLMPNGPMQITSGPFEPDLYKSEMEVQDAELKALLQISASRKTQKKKKKKASKTAENATSGETLEENEAGD